MTDKNGQAINPLHEVEPARQLMEFNQKLIDDLYRDIFKRAGIPKEYMDDR